MIRPSTSIDAFSAAAYADEAAIALEPEQVLVYSAEVLFSGLSDYAAAVEALE